MQLEDQIFSKRCGHFTGKRVVPKLEMVDKIRPAVDSRIDSDFQSIVRTDILTIDGIDPALDRAHACVAAGAGVTFIEAFTCESELLRIACGVGVPQVDNVVLGGQTPDLGHDGFSKRGFSIVLYARTVLQAALKASFQDRQSALAKNGWDERERRFSSS